MPISADEAEQLQRQLREQVEPGPPSPVRPSAVTGLDVSYVPDSDRVCAAAVVVDPATAAVLETSIVFGAVTFPYVPGLLAFREVPILLEAIAGLSAAPEVLVCDGYGIAHPRRFGLACHLGVVTGLPAFGVAKTPFTTPVVEPERARGSWTSLTEDGAELGRALRTRHGVKPVYVSAGHRIGLDEACELSLRLATRYRLPEATRQADLRSREALRTRQPDPEPGGATSPNRPG